MVEIDKIIDQKPTKALVKELAVLRIRNLQAFRELKELNDNGRFLYKHPLIVHFSLRVQLQELYTRDPDEFMNEFARTKENVKRYNSFLNNKKRPAMQKQKDKTNLDKHLNREQVMKDIVKSKP